MQPVRPRARRAGQLGDTVLGQRCRSQVLRAVGRESGEHRAERGVTRELVVPVGRDEQRRDALEPPAEEHEEVERGVVGPVHVLHDDDVPPGAGAGRPELVEERGEHGLAARPLVRRGGQPRRERAAGLPGDVVQRAECPWGQQRVAHADEHAGVGAVTADERPHERGLADAGLTRDEHGPTRVRAVGQVAVERVEQLPALQQPRRHVLTMPPEPGHDPSARARGLVGRRP